MNTTQEHTNTPSHCKAILVIDDDPGIRDVLRMSLELEGYNVVTAGEGKEALAALAKIERPCLILLDLMMPTMNGWQFAAAIEKDVVLAQIPVAIVTAYADKAASIKAEAIIKKPIDLEALYQVVKKWCH